MPEMQEPNWTDYVRARLRLPALPGRREDRMIAELADHLRDIYHDALSRGSTPEQAMVEAERRLSDADVAAAELLGSEPSPVGAALHGQVERADAMLRSRGRRWTILANLFHDLRDSVRSLRRQPGFTAIAVVSLAIGIGANTAVFTLVNVITLRALPYERPEELVDVHLKLPTFSFPVLSYPDFEDVRDRTKETFRGMVASQLAFA